MNNRCITFTTTLHKFESNGDKTGWTYIVVPADLANLLKSGYKKSFRVKGKLDNHAISGVALLPFGNGNFLLAVNATMRKAIAKQQGAMVQVSLMVDEKKYELNKDFVHCLSDEPTALAFFNTLPTSHQNYFSKWIDAAKTETTKVKRISMSVTALARKMGYSEMIRFNREKE